MTTDRCDIARQGATWRRQGIKVAIVALAIAASPLVAVSGALAQADDAPSDDSMPPEVFRWPVEILGDDFLENVFGDDFPASNDSIGGDFNVGGSTGGNITIGGGSGGISIGGGSSDSMSDE
jgi:hypothetical protein